MRRLSQRAATSRELVRDRKHALAIPPPRSVANVPSRRSQSLRAFPDRREQTDRVAIAASSCGGTKQCRAVPELAEASGYPTAPARSQPARLPAPPSRKARSAPRRRTSGARASMPATPAASSRPARRICRAWKAAPFGPCTGPAASTGSRARGAVQRGGILAIIPEPTCGKHEARPARGMSAPVGCRPLWTVRGGGRSVDLRGRVGEGAASARRQGVACRVARRSSASRQAKAAGGAAAAHRLPPGGDARMADAEHRYIEARCQPQTRGC